MNKINLAIIPRYSINLRFLNNPADLCKIVKKNNTRLYIYSIKYKGIVLKFGKSIEISPMFGERIYRQVGHSLSWSKPLIGKCGSDWYTLENAFVKTYGYNIDKNDLVITIWDFTNYPFQSININREIEKYESDMIQEYVKLVGEKPIGNVCDDTTSKKMLTVSKQAFSKHFK